MELPALDNTESSSVVSNVSFLRFVCLEINPKSDEISDSDVSLSEDDLEMDTLVAQNEELSLSGENEGENGEKISWVFHSKKAIVSKASTSVVGKLLFNKFVDEQTSLLWKTIKKMITDNLGEKQSKRVKKNLTKLTVKVLLLYDEKKLKDESFANLQFLFRRICSTVRNNYSYGQFDEATAKRLSDLVRESHSRLSAVLQPYLSSRTLKMLKETMAFMGSQEFLFYASKHPDFKKVVFVFAEYLDRSSGE